MMTEKKKSWKQVAKMYHEALQVELDNKTKFNGFVGTMIYIFGNDVMQSVSDFHKDPTPENKEKIRDQLELRFMEINNEDDTDA